jgi:hypothetical protein
MRKPALIRAVYAELRAMLGDEHSAVDLLKMAHLMVSAYADPLDELAEFGVAREGGRAFVALPVDEAMSDGGWQILSFERKRHGSWADRRNPLEMVKLNSILRGYLGPEWQHVDWIGNGLSPID